MEIGPKEGLKARVDPFAHRNLAHEAKFRVEVKVGRQALLRVTEQGGHAALVALHRILSVPPLRISGPASSFGERTMAL